ncbi:MAG: DUF134 domain-containing protein [Candidatus Cloacimonetes bacterium]|nr:DUF134 domain-containing protein [Candidatus Cloacimonadota bacterium]
MGRNCISRIVRRMPAVKGFRPFGRIGNTRQKVILSLDEYEVIRLLDHEGLTQEEAAIRMQVSRPTLTRIYDRARKKFASALIEGHILLIEGGDITFQRHVWLCEDCGAYSETDSECLPKCPTCNSPQLISLDECYRQQCGVCRKCHGYGRQTRLNRMTKEPTMKIAIPLTNGELSSHFGHCEKFAIYTIENNSIAKEETIDPPAHEPGSHPAFLHQLGCTVVIAGGMGMKAQELMCANGIKVVVGVPDMPLKDLVSMYLQGKLESGDNRCDH